MYDRYPDVIISGEKAYPVNTDFRFWAEIDELLHQGELTDAKLARIFHLCYKDFLPPNPEEAFSELIGFYTMNKQDKGRRKTSKKSKRIVSFLADEQYITAAFLSEYGIDLNAVDLHWWKFRTLFDGLSDKQKICEIMKIRAADISAIKDKRTKSEYRRLKSLYRLPDLRPESEIEADMADTFAKIIGI